MKKILTLLLLMIPQRYLYSQAGEWIWMKGDSTAGSLGYYGVQGVYDSLNCPPGLYEAAEWKDSAGHFWLFGGLSYPSYESNAFWEYDPSINQWRWVAGSNNPYQPGVYGTQGVPSPNNLPGARAWGATTWTDASGNFYLFGGLGYDANGAWGSLNDLWKYDVSIGEWTWITGSSVFGQSGVYGIKTVPDPANHPGGRSETNSSWIDATGNLWFFGGTIFTGCYNDLWKFDLSTLEWTWMKGSSGLNQIGFYGLIGMTYAIGTPGARFAYSKWKDQSGKFWLFSGSDYFSNESRNDVWKYDPLTNLWTWMSGSNAANPSGSLTSACDPQITNIPSGRYENRATWSDNAGHMWTFGGISGVNGSAVSYSDLWSFNSNTLEWTLLNGVTNGGMPGYYGQQGISSPFNYPKSRGGAVSWIDDDCNLWMFGGIGAKNDLWKFTPDPSCQGTFACGFNLPSQVNFGASFQKICEKFCINFYDSSTNNSTSWQWYFPGGDPSSSNNQNPINICYNSPGTYYVTLITTSASGNDTLTLLNYITVFATPPFPTITQVGYMLTSTAAYSYQWQLNSYDIPGATNQSYTVTQSGYYTVIVSDTNGCVNSASIKVTISGIDDVTDDGSILIYPNPSSGSFTVELPDGFMAGEVSIDVVNTLGQKVFSAEEKVTAVGFKKEMDLNDVARGVYFIEIKTEDEFVREKILITE